MATVVTATMAAYVRVPTRPGDPDAAGRRRR
jgi:hypothetical protein